MSISRDLHWLQHRVDSARRAMQYVRGLTEAQFYTDLMVQDAVSWRITIIGEAERRVSDPTRIAIPGLPWKQIVQMRNRLVHEYAHIRADLVWVTAQHDLSVLVLEIESFLKSAAPGGGPP